MAILKGLDQGHTIVPAALDWHKPIPRWAIFLLLTSLGLPKPAQTQAPTEPIFTAADAVLFAAAAGLYLAPGILGIDGRDANCAPCDTADVPFFDRWAVTEPRAALSDVSSGLVAALAVGTWWSLATRGPTGRRNVVASAQSAALATGLSVAIQEIVGRDRPVLYTNAPGDVDPAETRPSFLSGHTAVAFALASSYLLSGVAPNDAAKIAAVAAATVGAARRVASGRHFPSDVAGGAVIGVGSALLVHSIRF